MLSRISGDKTTITDSTDGDDKAKQKDDSSFGPGAKLLDARLGGLSNLPMKKLEPIRFGMGSLPWVPETDLIKRAKKKDPEVVEVGMGQTRFIDVPPGEKKQVFTYGLSGCTAVAVVSKHPDGKRSLTLSHHPPISTQQQVQELRKELSGSKHAPGSADVKHEVFVVTPGDWVKDTGGKYAMEANQQDTVKQLTEEIQARLPGIQCKVLPYSESWEIGKSSAFVLQVPAKADDPIRYQGTHSGTCEI